MLGILIKLITKKNQISQPDDVCNRLNLIQTQIIQLAEANKQTLDINRSVIELQNILKVPKARGIRGEALLAEQLSKLPKDFFKTQFQFKNGSICDAVLCLDNNLMLPIDSKFSLENFEKMTNATNENESKSFEKSFHKDIKNRINEIKDKYILPNETLDMAFMYIPQDLRN
jgi:DNA recombination protein RmuC